MPDRHRVRPDELTRRRSRENLKTTPAWAPNKSLRDPWRCRKRLAAEEHWRWWYSWATRPRLEPVIDVARMLKRHLPNVLIYFRHRISNAMSEG